MKHSNCRFLEAGLVIGGVIFGSSMALLPEWRAETHILVALTALEVTIACGFLAHFRQTVEAPQPDPTPGRETHTSGSVLY